MSAPARRGRAPRAAEAVDAPQAGSPVEVRLIGHDDDVRRLVAAMRAASGTSCGPVSFRAARSGGTRAYLSLVIPPEK